MVVAASCDLECLGAPRVLTPHAHIRVLLQKSPVARIVRSSTMQMHGESNLKGSLICIIADPRDALLFFALLQTEKEVIHKLESLGNRA